MQEPIAISTTPPLPGLLLVQQANAAMETIATDFAGDSDPAANASAYTTWAQTSTGLLFRRNATNTAWVEIGRVLERPFYAEDLSTGALATGGFKNKLINGLLAINQRAVSGTVVLSAGAYGHDRFKAGSGGCTYTFSASNGVTTLNITAGTLVQVVEGSGIRSGVHTLTWQGTAQGRINAGPFSSSIAAATLVGGANATVEFGTGTLSLPQLEAGATGSLFEVRPMACELSMARRYFRAGTFAANVILTASAPAGAGIRYSLPFGEPMRIGNPTVGVDTLSWQVYDNATGWISIGGVVAAPETGLGITLSFTNPGSIPVYSAVIIRNATGANFNISAEL